MRWMGDKAPCPVQRLTASIAVASINVTLPFPPIHAQAQGAAVPSRFRCDLLVYCRFKSF